MFKYSAFLLLLIGQVTFGSNWRPSEGFLSAIRYVESSNGALVYGDAGQSLGDFQISEAAWMDVNAWRKSRNLRCYTYDRHVFDRKLNRLYAADYLSILYVELSRKLSRQPTNGELYAAYNLGLSQFRQCKYQLAKVNSVTRRKCEQITRWTDTKAQAQFAINRVGRRT